MAESCNVAGAVAFRPSTAEAGRRPRSLPLRSSATLSPRAAAFPSCRRSYGGAMRICWSCGSAAPIQATASPSFGSRMEDSVRKTVSENRVVVYSKTWCSYCMEVKSLFKRLGIEPLVIELDQLGPQGPQLQKVLERITGQYTVPNVFIGGKHVGGCTDTVRLHRKGELATLLCEGKIEDTESMQQF